MENGKTEKIGLSKNKIAQILQLKTQNKARKKYQQTIVEGPQAVRELLLWAPQLCRNLYVTRQALQRYPEISLSLKKAQQNRQIWVHYVNEDEFGQLSGDAQGLLAVIDVPPSASLEKIRAGKSPKLWVGTAAISDPGNLGTIIRCADAAGAQAVILAPGSAELTSPKTVRSTAGSLFHLPVVTGSSLEAQVETSRALGMQVICADARGHYSLAELVNTSAGCLEEENIGVDSHNPRRASHEGGKYRPDLRRPTLWLFGNEAHGFTDAQRALADAVVSIPLYGKAESLNVAAATSICLYASAMAQNS